MDAGRAARNYAGRVKRMRRWYAWLVKHAPRIRDLLYVGFSLLTVLAQTLSMAGSQSTARSVAVIGSGAVASLALWWRRRYPVSVTLITVLGLAIGQVFVPLGLALLTLAIRRRDLVLALLTLAGYAAYVATYWADSTEVLALILTGPFLVGSWVAVGAYIGARRDLMVSLRDRAERAESERELRADQARLGERARIAQEMHDVLAHKVSLIALHAGGLEVNPAVGPEKVESSAGLIRETARQAMEDLRGVLGVLRTDLSVAGEDLTPVPQMRDLDRLAAESRAAGVSVTTQLDLPADVPAALGRTVYRIVQESLTNVHKHARAAAAEVVVDGATGQGITVRVTNVRPVAAGSLLPGAGSGLVGLRERVDLAGGTLSAGPTPDGGWQVEAWLPWPPGAAPPAVAPALDDAARSPQDQPPPSGVPGISYDGTQGKNG